jgi:DivIVA domain-containing protein
MAVSEPRTRGDLLRPEQIANQRFMVAKRGYETDEVEAYLHDLAEGVERMQGELEWLRARADHLERRNVSAQEATYARLARDFTSAIKAADDAARRVLEEAEEEARRTLTSVAERSAAAVSRADERARQVLADARREADAIVAQARAEAEDILATARPGTPAPSPRPPAVGGATRAERPFPSVPSTSPPRVEAGDPWSSVWQTERPATPPAPSTNGSIVSSVPAADRPDAVTADTEASAASIWVASSVEDRPRRAEPASADPTGDLDLDLGIDDSLLDLFDGLDRFDRE